MIEDLFYSINENNVEQVLHSIENDKPLSCFRRFRILLKAYELFDDYLYYKRAINELEHLLDNIQNQIFSSIVDVLEETSFPKTTSSLLTSTNPRESIFSIKQGFDEEWSGSYILYLLNRLIGKEDDALTFLRACSSYKPSLNAQLSDFMLLLSYAGKFRELIFDEKLNPAEGIFPPGRYSFLKKGGLFYVRIPEHSVFLIKDFLDFALLFYDVDSTHFNAMI